MSWKALITDKGNALSAKTMAGCGIELTRVKAGSGIVPESDLHSQEDILSVKQILSIENIQKKNNIVNIEILLTCIGVETSYNLNQIGIYATDPDDGEILFAIAQSNTGKSIPAESEVPFYSIDFNFSFCLENDQSMVATIDQSTFATKQYVEVVNSRIDNIIAQSGSTEGNTELIDIRVGSDGKTYQTAGEAIREQLEKKANLTDLSTPYNYKGSCLYSNLPSSGNTINDTYYVEDRTCKYTWNGTGWYQSSLNESAYEDELGSINEALVQYIGNRYMEYDEANESLKMGTTPGYEPGPAIEDKNEAKLHFIALKNSSGTVSTGDCTVIELKNKNVMIDCGMDSTCDSVIERLDDLGINKIDVIILTHMHKDHCGSSSIDTSSLVRICNKYKPHKVYIPVAPEWSRMIDGNEGIQVDFSAEYAFITNFCSNKDIQLITVDSDRIDKISDAEFTFFNASRDIYENYYNETRYGEKYVATTVYNNFSLCCKMVVNGKVVYFTGDIESKAQEMNLNKFSKCDILKAPHHFLNYYECIKFYELVSPDVAVAMSNITIENNKMGRILASSCAKDIYTTGMNGNIDISISTQGITYSIENMEFRKFVPYICSHKGLIGEDNIATFEELCKLLPVQSGVNLNMYANNSWCPEPFKTWKSSEGYYFHLFRITSTTWTGYACLKDTKGYANGLANIPKRSGMYLFSACNNDSGFSYEFTEISKAPYHVNLNSNIEIGQSVTINNYYPDKIKALKVKFGVDYLAETKEVSVSRKNSGGEVTITLCQTESETLSHYIIKLTLLYNASDNTMKITYTSCKKFTITSAGSITYHDKLTNSVKKPVMKGYEIVI